VTLTTNARLAGIAFLVYIAAGVTSMAARGIPHATAVLSLLTSLCALVLGVTLYAITRAQDADIALLALTCRVIEALPGEDAAFFFAVGSMLFSWLLLRGRMVPVALARLGVVASVLLVVVLPSQRVGLLGGMAGWSSSMTWLVWFPMLVFELALAIWLLTKGVAPPGGGAG
jgi:hypothetical protein